MLYLTYVPHEDLAPIIDEPIAEDCVIKTNPKERSFAFPKEVAK